MTSWTCQTAVAAVYTYTPPAASDNWSSGISWSAIPVSDASTELTFVGNNATVLGSQVNVMSFDDIAGPFNLNQLDLQGTGPSNGIALIAIRSTSTGNYLNFVNNGSAAPEINLNANVGTSSSTLAYYVYLNIALTNDTTFQGDGTAYFGFYGVISGSGGLIKNGASTLSLTGTNTYSGPTTISNGRLLFANGALGTTCSLIFNGGTLQWATGNTQDISSRFAPIASGKTAVLDTNGNNVSFASALSGGGGVTKIGSGTLTLSGANTYAGGTTISAGVLAFAVGSLDSTSAITFNGGTLQWAAGNTQDISGRLAAIASGASANIDTNGNNVSFGSALSGAGSVNKVGSGTLTLAASNTYTGATTISNGALQLGDGVALNGSVGGNIVNNAALIFANPNDQTYSGAISGSGSLTKSGAGALTLGGLNTFSGDTKIVGGSLVLGNGNALGSSTFDCGGYGGDLSFGALSTAIFGGLKGSQNLSLVNASSAPVTLMVGNNGQTTIYSGTLSGAGSLTKIGTGVLTIDGVNTFAGGATISAGVLQAKNTNALPGYNVLGKIVVTNGGTMAVSAGGADEWSAADIAVLASQATFNTGSALGIDTTNAAGGSFLYSIPTGGKFGLTKTGSGTLILTGIHTYSGNTVVSAGALQLGDASAANGSVAGNITNSASLVFANPYDQTYSGIISGSGSLTKTGAGTLILAGANTYTGDTLVMQGTLTLGNVNALQSSSLGGDAGAVTFGALTNATLGGLKGNRGLLLANDSNASLSLTIGNNGQSTTYGGALSGTGSLIKAGTGTLTLTGANTYTGSTTISAGILTFAAGSLDTTSSIIFNGGTLQWATGNAQDVLIASASIASGKTAVLDTNGSNVSFASSTSGAGGVTKTGSGTLTLSGANTYTGITTISAGILAFAAGSLDASSSITFSGGTLQWTAGNTQDVSSRIASVASGKSAIIDTNGNIVLFGSAIGGAGSLNKIGSGTLTITASNTYTGATTVSGGILQLGDGNALNGSVTAIVDNAALVFANATDQTYSGAISGSGTLAKTGIATLTLSHSNTFSGDTQVQGGILKLSSNGAIAGSTLDYGGYGGTLSFGTLTAGTFGGLKGNQDLALANDSLAAVTLTVGGNNQSTTYSGVLSGPGSLTKTGSGTLTLANANTFSGITTVSAGALALGNSNALQNSVLNCAGGTVSVGTLTSAVIGGLSGSQALALTNDNSQPVALTVGNNDTGSAYAGTLTGSGSLTKIGTGTLTLSGTNTFTGYTKIAGGVLYLNNAMALQNSTLDLGNYGGNISFGYLTGATFGGLQGGQDLTLINMVVNPVALTIGKNDVLSTYSGSIYGAYYGLYSGVSTITKVGTGTFTITGSLDSHCSTTISSGVFQIGDGNSNSSSVASSFTNNAALIFNTASSQTCTGAVGGTGALTKTGPGALTLSATNTYSGGTLINNGTLSVKADVGLGAVPSPAKTNITFSGNGTLQWGAAFSTNVNRQIVIGDGVNATFDVQGYSGSVAGQISGGGSLTKTGSGQLSLTGSNTYSGGTIVAAGALSAPQTASMPGYNTPGKIVVNAGAALGVGMGGTGQWTDPDVATLLSNATFNPGSAFGIDTTNAPTGTFQLESYFFIGAKYIYAGAVTGNLGLAKLGSGLLVLNSTQTYAGPTTIYNGSLVPAAGDDCLPTSTAVTLQSGANLVLSHNQTIGSLSGAAGSNTFISSTSTLTLGDSSNTTYGGSFSGTGQILKQGSGTLALGSNSSNFFGRMTISAGTLELDNVFLPTTPTNNGAIVFNIVSNMSMSHQSSGVYISGSGSVSKTGGGVLTIASPDTYFGDTTICGGQLIIGHINTLQNSTLDYDNYGGTLSFGSIVNATLGGLKGSQNLTLTNTSSIAVSLTVGNNNQSTAYGGILDGYGSLTKIGAGTLLLSGANAYQGSTTISAGTLALGADNALPAASNLILGGGTLATNSFDQINSLGTMALTGNSTIDMGSLGGSVLDFADSHLMPWSGTLTISNWNGSLSGGGADELFCGSSNSALTAGQLSDIVFINPNGLSGQFQATILPTGEIVPVPEPMSLVILSFGVACLLGYGRQRRKHTP
jgi:autotransporter-associated beta strand protein